MAKNRNIITEKDCIKAHSIDRKGNILATVYDSGFTCISSVISQLNQKGGGWLHPIYEVSIYNIDRDWCARYNKNGKLRCDSMVVTSDEYLSNKCNFDKIYNEYWEKMFKCK